MFLSSKKENPLVELHFFVKHRSKELDYIRDALFSFLLENSRLLEAGVVYTLF